MNQCDPHYYENEDDNTCYPCHTSCKECFAGDEYSCQECYDDTYLEDHQCKEECEATAVYEDDDENECKSCH